jgi:GT2 family glycosyltransferase
MLLSPSFMRSSGEASGAIPHLESRQVKTNCPAPELTETADSAQPSVACILLNWNGWEDTVGCLTSLSKLNYRNFLTIVVDNGSSNDSVTRLRDACPEILLLETGRNLGFAGGNNVGIRHAISQRVEYIWLLNNDTEPHPDALTELVNKAASNPRFGAIGSTLMYAHDPNSVQAWGGGRINVWIGRSFHTLVPQEDGWFDYITAASVLIPRRALEDVGLLDDGFFLYWEDGDLSFRLRKKGWKLGVAAGSTVLHKEHASTGRNRRVIDRYVIASGIRFLHKHSPAPWLSIPLFLALRIWKRLLSGQFRRVGDIAGGIRDYLFSGRIRS